MPFSEMLAWENNFSQDEFRVDEIDNDLQFLRFFQLSARY